MIRTPRLTAGLLASAAILALAACNKPEPAAPASETPAATKPVATPAVDPNALTSDGIGAIRIGQTVDEVQAAAGAPATPIAAPQECNIFHPARAPAGVFVMTEEGKVTRISLREGAAAKTDKGFGVGSTATEIKAAYGGAVIVQPAKYDPAPAEDLFVWAKGGSTDYVTDPTARGVRYEVGTNGKVTSVHAGGPSIQLAESCG